MTRTYEISVGDVIKHPTRGEIKATLTGLFEAGDGHVCLVEWTAATGCDDEDILADVFEHIDDAPEYEGMTLAMEQHVDYLIDCAEFHGRGDR